MKNLFLLLFSKFSFGDVSQITLEIAESQKYLRELTESDISLIKQYLQNRAGSIFYILIYQFFYIISNVNLDGVKSINDRFIEWNCGLQENFEEKLTKFIETNKETIAEKLKLLFKFVSKICQILFYPE